MFTILLHVLLQDLGLGKVLVSVIPGIYAFVASLEWLMEFFEKDERIMCYG